MESIPNQKQLNVMIPADLLRRVKVRAALDGIQVRELVEAALRSHLKRLERKG